MQILFIIPSFLPEVGGAQRQCELVGRELVHRGHAVDVLTRRVPGQPRRETVGGMTVHRVFPFAVPRRLHSPVMILTTVFWFLRHGRKFDIVHSFRLSVHNVAVAWLGPLFHWRWLARMAGAGAAGDLAPVPPGIRHAILQNALNHADVLIALSTVMRSEMVDFGLSPERTLVLDNAVDVQRFDCPKRDFSSADRLLFVGRLSGEKNLEALIRALTDNGLSGMRLSLVGEGDLQAGLAEFADGLGLGGRVLFRGAATREEMPRHYCEHDVFVLPSLSEGMSNALLEAMAAGMVCVCTPVGGAPDLIRDGENGILAASTTAKALADALVRARGMTARQREEMGQRAVRTVRTGFSVSIVVDRLENLYRGE